MEQARALNALEQFIVLTKSASSPRAAVDLIIRATSHPNTYIFAELLDTAPVQGLADSPEYSAYLTLLKIFSYGIYTDYYVTPNLPKLNEAQIQKLRQLSIITLAKDPAKLTYENLIRVLELRDERELEDLVISCLYAGLLTATLDPYHKIVCVTSVSPLRDLPPNSIPSMLNALNEWSSRCESTLADLEKQIVAVRAEALKRKKEQKDWAAHVDKLVEDKNEQDKLDGGRGGKRLGPAAKRGSGMMGAGADYDDGKMDLDEEDEAPKASKKRGFANIGFGK
ncbi:hypothetical protein F5884DRAFT_787763 [Xylogone sp. PMI_703]|nr:hypothetical protein F5884DRAFT_787763 [Xylogone sp. PMI_703]